jgi:serine/threonine-protein kinase HipA
VYKAVDAIEVRVWGQRVGALALDPRLGCYAFEYEPAFVRSGIEIAPLTMPLRGAREPFAFPGLPALTYLGLPGAIADALPDDFGNLLIDAWLAREGVEKSAITPLDRLAYMGKRALGALEFKPERGPTGKSTAIEMAELVESARRAVAGDFSTDALAAAALAQLIQVGTSAGGARAKAAIAWNPETNEIRAGQFDVARGFEHWLLKFDGVGAYPELGLGANYGRIEFAYHRMASAAGIAMAPCRLFEESGRAHFMTRRFDREGNTKHHVQTLCALAHLDYRQKATHDVGQMFLAMRRLDLDYPALEEAFRRVVFNVMAANCDDHSKNVSLLLRQGGTWELAPAYDVTHAFNPKGEWTYQHLMSVNGKFTDIGRDDLLAVGAAFGLGTAPKVVAGVRGAVAAWPTFADEAGLASDDVRRIAEHHRLL